MKYLKDTPLPEPVQAKIKLKGEFIEITVTHAVWTKDGKHRNRVTLPDGTTKLVSTVYRLD